MPEFLQRLLIGVLVIVLTQILLGVLKLREEADRAIFLIVLVGAIIYIVFGNVFPF